MVDATHGERQVDGGATGSRRAGELRGGDPLVHGHRLPAVRVVHEGRGVDQRDDDGRRLGGGGRHDGGGGGRGVGDEPTKVRRARLAQVEMVLTPVVHLVRRMAVVPGQVGRASDVVAAPGRQRQGGTVAQHTERGARTRRIERAVLGSERSDASDGQDRALPLDDAMERVDTRRRSRGSGRGGADRGADAREAGQVDHQVTRAGSGGAARGGGTSARGSGGATGGGCRASARAAATSEHVDGGVGGRTDGRRRGRDVVAGVANVVVGEINEIASRSGLLGGGDTTGDRDAGGRGVSETGGLGGQGAQRSPGLMGRGLTGVIRIGDEVGAGHGLDAEPVHLAGRDPTLHENRERRGLLAMRIACAGRGRPVLILVLLTSKGVRLVAGPARGEGGIEVRKLRGVDVAQGLRQQRRTLLGAGAGARHHEGGGGRWLTETRETEGGGLEKRKEPHNQSHSEDERSHQARSGHTGGRRLH